ncbi:MAG: endonuclease III [Spirochaetaceae bacterium]|nr:MAG: endonuclease III [Spirochaetaceae bacterium]
MKTERSRSREFVLEVHQRMLQEYPVMQSFLTYRNGFELLIAVILSARTTDQSVNEVTPELFRRYPGPDALANAEPPDLEKIVHRTGFYRAKAANIKETAQRLADIHKGVVPSDMELLTALPGVGRKTAHVIRGTLFGLPSIIVDTHFGRVTRRLGFTGETDPLKVERDLETLIPPEVSHSMSMRLNKHGRVYCTARRPKCGDCPLNDICPSAHSESKV